MAKIKIDIDALVSNRSALVSQIQELAGYNRTLGTLIEEIKNNWEGGTSEDYYSMMRGYYNQAAKMMDVLQEFKKYADTTINKFETLDNQSASRIRNSF